MNAAPMKILEMNEVLNGTFDKWHTPYLQSHFLANEIRSSRQNWVKYRIIFRLLNEILTKAFYIKNWGTSLKIDVPITLIALLLPITLKAASIEQIVKMFQ